MEPPEEHVNPYNFTRPVTRPAEFAGRKAELGDIRYYLDLTRAKDPRFVNVSLIGDRASGKTSLLHMVEHLANERGLLPVKIALNEETSTSDILLFKEIIDAIVTEGVGRGMYGGLRGKIYRNFRKLLDTLNVEVKIPFLFGTAYVGQKKHGPKVVLPQHIVVKDLEKIREEALSKGIAAIVILLDECDLLARDTALLQKIRNIFSTLEGYQLFLSGTEGMFPAISEVFSPVPRLFKRINVTNFKDPDEVSQCILSPLPEDERTKIHPPTVGDVFRLTGGSPYEVKLISHFMYKHYKLTGAGAIALSTQVLDDVLLELDRFRSRDREELLGRLRQVPISYLPTLVKVLELGEATPDQVVNYGLLAKVESLSPDALKESRENLRSSLLILSDSGLLERSGNLVRFSGDDFDRLYLKYYCVAQGVQFASFAGMDPLHLVAEGLNELITSGKTNYRVNAKFDRKAPGESQLGTVGGRFTIQPGESTLELGSPTEWERGMYEDDDRSLRFRASIRFFDRGYVTRLVFDSKEVRDEVLTRLGKISGKLRFIGIDILSEDEYTLINAGVRHLKDREFDQAILYFDKALELNPYHEYALAQRALALWRSGKEESAIETFDRALSIHPRWVDVLVVKGALLVEAKKFDQALEAYDRALQMDPTHVNALIDKGRLLALTGRYKEALELNQLAKELNPQNPLPWNNESDYLRRLGASQEALEAAEKALELDPKHRLAHINKALALLELDDIEEALSWVENSLERFESEPMLWDVAAKLHQMKGDYSKALQCTKIALEQDPTQATRWLYLGEIHLARGEPEESVEAVKEAISLDSGLRSVIDEEPFKTIRDRLSRLNGQGG